MLKEQSGVILINLMQNITLLTELNPCPAEYLEEFFKEQFFFNDIIQPIINQFL